MDLVTRADLMAIARDIILTRATRIDPAQVDIEGSDVNLIVGVSSILAAQIINQLAYRTAALTLDGSDGEDLDRYAFDRYQLTRKGASPALGTVRIFRATTAGGPGTIPTGTKLATLTGVEYIMTTAASLGVADLTTSATVRAVQAGRASQVSAGQISRFSSAGLLFDRTLQATNDAATAGGEDAEDDETFRDRIRDFWRSARRGILAAIEFGARQVPGVVSAQAVEVLSPDGNAARLVQLFISDSTGVASDALATQVRIALGDFRAGGIQVLVSPSLPQLVSITIDLTFRANVDTATLTDQIRSSIVAFVNSLPVNGPLFRAEIFTVLQRFAEDGLIVNNATLVLPTGDLIPTTGQTIRTTVALVLVTAI
jgi:uncharacterized phage protein gp47/JayE